MINNAYDTLKNKESKLIYDQKRKEAKNPQFQEFGQK